MRFKSEPWSHEGDRTPQSPGGKSEPRRLAAGYEGSVGPFDGHLGGFSQAKLAGMLQIIKTKSNRLGSCVAGQVFEGLVVQGFDDGFEQRHGGFEIVQMEQTYW